VFFWRSYLSSLKSGIKIYEIKMVIYMTNIFGKKSGYRFLLLFLIFVSFKVLGEGGGYKCSKEKGRTEYRLRSCKTGLEAKSTDNINIKKSKKIYAGKNIVLELNNIEANVVFSTLADFSGYSLLMDANINREIFLERTEVPWDQALEKLAEYLNLKAKIINSIIYVETPVSLRKYKPIKKRYYGSTLSLNFLSIKITDLFKVLEEFTGNSFVLGTNLNKKINSEISIKRNNIPWDQALDDVSQFLNLKTKIFEGVIYVE